MRVRILPAAALERTVREEWVDRSRRPFVEDGLAYIPVKEGRREDAVIGERCRYRGRGYQMIGDIAVVHGKRPNQDEAAGILAWRRPRGLLWMKGYAGIERIPDCEILYGTADDTVHREAGIAYHLNPARVMFAQGNREEKARIARLVRKSRVQERVADMFAGIGYFTLPAARAGARVHAMEINPVAFGYLTRNIAANSVEGRVLAECGDCRTLLSGEYDRIMMGHLSAIEMLPSALGHAGPGTVIHLHGLSDEGKRIREIASEAGFGARVETRRVKKYAPGVVHLVQDVTLT